MLINVKYLAYLFCTCQVSYFLPPSLPPSLPQVSLVVNVASECGYTDSNYRKLVQLQRDLEPRGFTVLAFPCNQFHGQEPAANQEILEFAMESYSINFPLFSKINVKGDNAHEVYQFLAEKTGNIPLWNFNKYLIDRDGLVVQFFAHDREFADISRSLEHLLSRRYEL